MNTLSETLAILKANRQQHQAMKAHLTPADWQKPISPEGWSGKDYLAHIAHWDGLALQCIHARLAEAPAPVFPFIASDEQNERWRIEDSSKPLDTVHAWLGGTFDTYQRVLTEHDEEALQQQLGMPWNASAQHTIIWLIEHMAEHEKEHLSYIESFFPAE